MDPGIGLVSVLALFGLWIAVYYLWRDYRNDSFREDIFSIRDAMFLWAAQDNISFGHPAYRILRDRMNTLLRHGHELTLTRMVLILMTHSVEKPEALVRWETALETLPEEIQEKMKEFNVRVTIFVLQHVVLHSFFRHLIIRPFALFVQPERVVEVPKVASGVERLESETEEKEARLLGRAVVTA